MLTMQDMDNKPVKDGVIYLSESEFKQHVNMRSRVNSIRTVYGEDRVQQILSDNMAGRRPVTFFNYKVECV